ncbi:hypothetical protein [Sporosarcina obsidiansis]|uniref:hypothetical protein n=1 Tax=Sporosarcina obsidiansis TaxID=2660748 RepID=UPI00129A9B16|nr:hypothetical protein [Sporosarcina obsidiansis]
MNENQWIYNTNEEVWMNCGSYDTKEEAIQAGKDEYEGNRYQFYVGQISNINLVPGVNVDYIIEDIAENVYSEVGEAAECYLDDVRKEDSSELEDKLNKVLFEWMDKHDYMPKYFRVNNIECIRLSE